MKIYENITTDTDLEKENLKKVLLSVERISKTPTVKDIAIMPDSCPTGEFSVPVGVIVATGFSIHPAYHSADLCCSLASSCLGKQDDHSKILDIAQDNTVFSYGKTNKNRFSLPDALKEKIANNIYTRDFMHQAERDLGSQGDGNHFLSVGTLESSGETYLTTHHGSRSFGSGVYKLGVTKAQQQTNRKYPNINKWDCWLDTETEIGRDYWEALQIVREWTFYNHYLIHQAINNEVDNTPETKINFNAHNFVFTNHDPAIFYHAKGATPIFDEDFTHPLAIDKGVKLIPLSMNQPILMVKACKRTRKNISLGFCPHGAGRNMSRGQFFKNINLEEALAEIEGLDIRFYTGNPDYSELPSAYKNAQSVIDDIERFNLCDIVDKINPKGCIMAGRHNKKES